jgi:hypothetical protein
MVFRIIVFNKICHTFFVRRTHAQRSPLSLLVTLGLSGSVVQDDIESYEVVSTLVGVHHTFETANSYYS